MILKFTSELENSLQQYDVNLFFIHLVGMPMLIMAYGHQKADEIAQNLANKVGGSRIMSDQIFISKAAKNKAESKQQIAQIKEVIYNLEPYIAHKISHKYFTKGHNAHDAIKVIYSTPAIKSTNLSSNVIDHSTDNAAESLAHINQAAEIKQALANNKFKLAYQPIIETATGTASHYEALLRMEDASGNLKSAGGLIPAAENLGLIDKIDVYVLNSVVESLKKDKNLQLALNISNLTIGNTEWLKVFFESITPEIGKRLIIEITETSALKNLQETAYFIATLQDTGCQFALDDFGSGYTSFRQIRALSFDYVKLDGSMISDIATNKNNRLLVKALLEYLKSMNIKTIAEFVENGETAKILMEFGIDYMQGNYFGKAA